MKKLLISGGKKLKGEVKVSGAKNSALPLMTSALLTEGTSRFSNVPALRDIKTIADKRKNRNPWSKRRCRDLLLDNS